MYPYNGAILQCDEIPIAFPPQRQQVHPGLESIMIPRPVSESPRYKGTGKLCNKVAIITGGDSGIGRAVSYAFADEGADIAIAYLYEHNDAEETKLRIEEKGRRCVTFAGDIGYEGFCKEIVEKTIKAFGHIDILVNNVAVQYVQKRIEDISSEQLEKTFRTNILSFFYMTKAVMPYLTKGSTIINTTSVTAYQGFKELIDYSSTQGAINTFTYSMALNVVDKGIRVNAVAPGPIWTPLIPSSFSPEDVAVFGRDVPMKRAGQPFELAPAYVFLASEDSSYITGQVIHVNGGTIVHG